ncbi:sensor histidine kinase [Poseidonibacter sp.]|uniref:sensor histidine kinase n=1 Tax=Poseidonibacter sp. TaxID=2321188 RepID=UPI003C74F382
MKPILQRYAKQFYIIAFIIFCTTIIASFIISSKINTTLIHEHFDKLDTLKNSLKVHIEKYFNSKHSFITTLSEFSDIKTAIKEFDNAFVSIDEEYQKDINQSSLIKIIQKHTSLVSYTNPNTSLKKELNQYLPKSINAQILQKLYIADNSNKLKKRFLLEQTNENLQYDKIHKKYHRKFVNILQREKFYDIFLINTQGDIVYSVFKELDFATNLNSGVYSDSSLANAYKKALASKSISFSDFKAYEPSYNKPAGFFAIPIIDNNTNIGVIAFQISSDEINNIVTFNKSWEKIGLGKSGEAYLVGSDYLMRSDSRFINTIDNKVVKELGTTIGILNVSSKAVKDVLEEKKNAHSIIDDYRKNEVLSSYIPIDIFDTKWALILEIDKKEISKEIYIVIISIFILGVVFAILSLILLQFVIMKLIVTPLDKFESQLKIKVAEKTKALRDINNHLEEKVNKQIIKLRQKDEMFLHQSRMAAVGELMENIAHQWRQPLSIITTHVSSMEVTLNFQDEIPKEQILICTQEVSKQSKYLSKTIDDFRDFIQTNDSSKTIINLSNSVDNTKKLLGDSIANNNILCIKNLDDISILANENHIVQILLNIFKNSIDAFKKSDISKKYIFIKIYEENNHAVISIKDNAGGVNEEFINKIFDPYVSSKHASIGTGLGLFTCYEMVTKIYNGFINVENVEYTYDKEQFKGLEIIINIPINN